MRKEKKFKAGTAVLIGRPSVGKSTLLNRIVGQKISIISPKPQTTRFPIQGVYTEKRGQIIFIDTPGIFEKIYGPVCQKINKIASSQIRNTDVILYLIDRTKQPGSEEARILGILRKSKTPKILVINKIDIPAPAYEDLYHPQKEECEDKIKISALKGTDVDKLIEKIFNLLPQRKPLVDPQKLSLPALNLTPNMFIAEIIREKVFFATKQEVPYTIGVKVKDIKEREKGVFFIKAVIYTLADRYKKMIIGKKGEMIKKIGIKARKELETITNKPVYLDLKVKTNKHWPEMLL